MPYFLVHVRMTKPFVCGYERPTSRKPTKNMILEALADEILWNGIDNSFEIEIETVESFRGKGSLAELVRALHGDNVLKNQDTLKKGRRRAHV